MTSAVLAVSQMPAYSKGSRGSWVSPSHQPPPLSPSSCPSTPTSSVGQARPLDPAEAPDRPPTNACHSCPKGLARDFSQVREKLWVWIPATGLTPAENEEESISPRLLGVSQYTPDFDLTVSSLQNGVGGKACALREWLRGQLGRATSKGGLVGVQDSPSREECGTGLKTQARARPGA